MLSEITQNPLLTGILGAIGGGLITWLIQQIQNKRGSFSYIVTHNQLAYSANDIVFGNVTVQWNGRNINNLYLSKIEITNESMNDYEDVVLSTYSSGTELLTEQTGIIGTPLVLKWSDNYSELVKVPNGGTPTDSQWSIYKTQREYIVPVINRGQVATISYLNEVNDITTRGIWVTATKKV
ncbi:MAG: hypothetical protein ACAH07_05310 [Methylophilaceae bacterium]|nr:hypothetical protein [Methyloradius sp.]